MEHIKKELNIVFAIKNDTSYNSSETDRSKMTIGNIYLDETLHDINEILSDKIFWSRYANGVYNNDKNIDQKMEKYYESHKLFDDDILTIYDIEYAINNKSMEILKITDNHFSGELSYVDFHAKLTLDYKKNKTYFIKMKTYDNVSPNEWIQHEPHIIFIDLWFSRSRKSFYDYIKKHND